MTRTEAIQMAAHYKRLAKALAHTKPGRAKLARKLQRKHEQIARQKEAPNERA